MDLLTSSAEERLARVLLRVAGLAGEDAFRVDEMPNLSDRALAAMVGTTRPRVNVLMNQFRRRGYVDHKGGLQVHQSLRAVLGSP